jgi:hypothetical protein
MILGGGIAAVMNIAPYSANKRFSTGDDNVEASFEREVSVIIAFAISIASFVNGVDLARNVPFANAASKP